MKKYYDIKLSFGYFESEEAAEIVREILEDLILDRTKDSKLSDYVLTSSIYIDEGD